MAQYDHAKVIEMAGAEVMSWNVDGLEYASSEVQGPIVVRLNGELVRNGMFPYYCHPIPCMGIRNPKLAGTLVIYDPRLRRYVGWFEKGEWSEVQHEPRYRDFYIGPRGGVMVR